MASAAALTTVQKLYIAYYGRPADAGGREYWASELDKAGGSLAGIINSFAGAAEAQALYGSGTTTADRVTVLYQNILGRTPDAQGLAYYVGRVEGTWKEPDGSIQPPLSLGSLALAILQGVQPTSDDAPLANNRLAVANGFTAQVNDQNYGGDAAAAIARTFLKQVTGDAATAAQANGQLPAYLNTMGVATRQPDKFASFLGNGLLTNAGIVSTTLTEQNLESAIQQLPPSAVGAEDAAGIRVTLSGSHVGGVVDSFVIKSLPANGALLSGDTVLTVGTAIPAIHSAAAVTFVPAPNFHGSTSFTFAAKNSAGLEDTTPAAASIAVMPVNDAPIGAADTVAALPNINTTISAAQLLGNDFDADGDVLFIKSVQSSTGGTVFGDADGNVIFSPSANFSGVASFTYVASDGKGGETASIPVTVNVGTANRAPLGGADTVSASPNIPVTYLPVQLLANDTDADGDALFIKSVSNGTGGTVVRNPNGSVTFTPNANFSGTATFSYVASDGKGGDSASIPVTVNVATANRAPVGGADRVAATQNTAATYTAAQLLANDTDADGDALFIKSVSNGTGGIVVRDPNGSVTFTPNANFSGAATFSYVASDGKGGDSAPIPVTVNVATANRAPVGGADSVVTNQNTAATYTAAQLLANDTDADGDALFIKSVSSGTGGTVVRNPNGSVTFTPNTNFSGNATFSYVASDGKGGDSAPIPVTVNVATTNRAPVGVTDSVAVTQNTTTVTYSAAQLLANDTDADGDALFIKYVDSSTGGTVVLNVDGTVTFTPNPNYSGMAYGYTYFFYIASDGKGGNTDWTLVNVNVASANNAPIIFGVPSAAERVTVGTPAALSDFSVSDPDGADVNLRVTLTTSNGRLNNVFDMDTNQPGVQLSGTAASINQILAGATFTATATGPAQIGISVTDGVASNPSTALYALTAVLPANQAPLLTLPRNTVFSAKVDYSQGGEVQSIKSADK